MSIIRLIQSLLTWMIQIYSKKIVHLPNNTSLSVIVPYFLIRLLFYIKDHLNSTEAVFAWIESSRSHKKSKTYSFEDVIPAS